MIEIRGAQNETKNDPQLNVCSSLAAATAPRKQPRPAKLRDAPGEVYNGGGCARQLS